MTIDKTNPYIAKVSQISSLFQLTEEKELLNNFCFVIVFPQDVAVIGNNAEEISAVKEFFVNAPFMTAIACDETTEETFASIFDIRLNTTEVEEYTEKLFKDKTQRQIMEINACFTASRTFTAEKVLELESKAFYRLMTDKNGGNSHE